MRILCLLFLFVLALVFPLFSFSFVDKGRILSNLLTLSGALLSCSHHESFHPKFTCLLFFLHTQLCTCVLHWDFPSLYVTHGPAGVHFLLVCLWPLGTVIIFFLSFLFE